MGKDVEYAANEAVFGMQLNRDQAVKFVVRNAGTNACTARRVLEKVMISYKTSEPE